MVISEKAYIKQHFQLKDFTYKSFFETFLYTDRGDAEQTLKHHLATLKNLVKAKGIAAWARDKLTTLETDLKVQPLEVYWQLIEQEKNKEQTLALARMEEAIYLRTRKRTLEDASNQLDNERQQKATKVEVRTEEPLDELILSSESGESNYSSQSSNESD